MPSYSPDEINRSGTRYLETVKRRSRAEWIAHCTAFACAILAVTGSELLPEGSPERLHLLVITGFLAGIAEFIAWQLRRRNEHDFAIGRRLRRIGVATNGLGVRWMTDDDGDISIMARPGQEVGVSAGDYFASKKSPGWPRVLDHVQESAYFSGELYQFSSALVFVVIVLFFAAAAAVAYAALHHHGSLAQLALVAQWTLVGASFVAGSGLMDQYARWRHAAHECKHAVAAADAIKNEIGTLSETELQFRTLTLYSDYAAVTLGALPPPSWLYLRKRKRLTDVHDLRYRS